MSTPFAQPSETPCQQCGACCASYRVSFYWAEAEALGLPDAMQQQLTPWHACMRGTHAAQPRCAALQGEIGRDVGCSVYASRPSPCREVQPGDARCNKARALHGLPSLPPN